MPTHAHGQVVEKTGFGLDALRYYKRIAVRGERGPGPLVMARAEA